MVVTAAHRVASSPRRARGRPRRIDQGTILAAAAQMSAGELSIPDLARRLGVSVAAVYRYVSGRDEVLELLGRQAMATLALPPRDRRHWAQWLMGYAAALREALRRFPGRISHVHPGAPYSPTSLDRVETFLSVLTHAGFSDAEAMMTYLLIVDTVFGFVHRELETAAEDRAGRSYRKLFYQTLAGRESDELPILRRLRYSEPTSDEAFDITIRTVLAGLAVHRGEPVPALARSATRWARPKRPPAGTRRKDDG